MSYKVDNRGSKDQRIIYDYLNDLYPSHKIIYEQPLYDLGQRIDIYIPSLALAFEYNGRQHYDFIEHFHKSIEGFKDALKMDQQKREYLILNGIKLIEIPYNKMVQSKEELLKLIHETDYPSFAFKPLPEESESQIDFKAKQKEIRKGKYQQSKSFYKEDADKKKQRLEKERQARKERYKKMKENK